ncbi:hypothetical protein [Dactylosporangium sp. CA-092794]|uniref:hypothetical protein n=1 Tax=Dactylosporangium sp. CA-092794 TaxID=3239929 RepID=UPI003D8A7708
MINTKRLAQRLLVGGIAAATVAAGLVVGVAGPASADPVGTYVGAGSDTTQDVLNGVADAIGLGIVSSWDAVDPVTHTAHLGINPKRNCTATRPNGSGEGVTAVRQSANVAAAIGNPFAGETDQPELGCVDFARSSSGPNPQSNTGRWVFIPFALDAVAVASQHTGDPTAVGYSQLSFDPTNLPTGAGTLQKLYRDGLQVTLNGTLYDPRCLQAPCTGGATPIHLYIPQSGSGTRSFWLAQMGIGTVPAWLHDRAFSTSCAAPFNTVDFCGASVEEHDGTVLQGDAQGIAPFSISQWVGQRNGHNDRRHGAHLYSLVNATTSATVNPLTGNFPTVETGALNTNFLIRREVFNVVEWSKVTSGQPNFDPTLLSVFGPGGAICGKASTIANFGFGLLNATTPHTCGAIVDSLRAFATD